MIVVEVGAYGAYPPRGCPQGLLLGEVGLQSLLDRRMEHSVIFFVQIVQRAAGMSSRSGEDQFEG
jgi:hypothetical protein